MNSWLFLGVAGCNASRANATTFTIGGHKSVPHDNETALAVAVARQPISIAIQANQKGFQHYKHGVFHGNCGDHTDHGVTLVGYGWDKNMSGAAGTNASWCAPDTGCVSGTREHIAVLTCSALTLTDPCS